MTWMLVISPTVLSTRRGIKVAVKPERVLSLTLKRFLARLHLSRAFQSVPFDPADGQPGGDKWGFSETQLEKENIATVRLS